MKITSVFFRAASLSVVMALAAVAFGMSAHQASAGLILFNSRAAFDAAAPGLPIEDFEEAATAPFQAFPGPLDSTSSNVAFSPGDILAGVTFSAAGVGELLVLNPGNFGAPSAILGPNTFTDDLIMAFGTGVNAVGFDLFSFSGTGNIAVNIFDSGGLISSTALFIDTTGTFFGVINWGDITSITFDDSAVTLGELVDNVAFGSATIPEPGTLALFGFGLLGLGLARRRKKTA